MQEISDLERAKKLLEMLHKDPSDVFLDPLKVLIDSGKVTLVQLELTQDEYEELTHTVYLTCAREALEFFRLYGPIPYLSDLQRFVGPGTVTLAQLGLTHEEYWHFLDQHEEELREFEFLRRSFKKP